MQTIGLATFFTRPGDWVHSFPSHFGTSRAPRALSTTKLDIEHAQWLELLHSFTSVKDLVLSGRLISLVAPVLGELIGERMSF